MNIAVVGLGKLGAVLAAVAAGRGHRVVGVDLNPETVRSINEGRAPVEETGLADLIACAPFLTATTDCQEAVRDSEIVLMVVPTPSEPDGAFSLGYVFPAMISVGRALREKTNPDFCVVVLCSTVLPGTMTKYVLPILEGVSGKVCGRDFGLCYNPEFIALGSVVHDMHNPDMILIGESDPRSGRILSDFYLGGGISDCSGICENTPVVARMSFVNAELAKLSVNAYVTTKISFANMLAGICENLPGADVEEVTRALGSDSRIGPKYLQGALGYAGPCFFRDNAALSAVARRSGTVAPLADTTDAINWEQVTRLAARVAALAEEYIPNGLIAYHVGVLGLSYKPNTPVIEESQSVLLVQELLSRGFQVAVYDPMAMANARPCLPSAHFCSSMRECAEWSHLLVIATAWDEFRSLKPDQLNHSAGRPTVVDCWRILDRLGFERSVTYVTIGEGPKTACRSLGATN